MISTLTMHKPFTNATGLQTTLFQYKSLSEKMTYSLQVIHYNGCHWVTAYKEDQSIGIVDSVNESVENLGDISKVIHYLFESPDSRTFSGILS